MLQSLTVSKSRGQDVEEISYIHSLELKKIWLAWMLIISLSPVIYRIPKMLPPTSINKNQTNVKDLTLVSLLLHKIRQLSKVAILSGEKLGCALLTAELTPMRCSAYLWATLMSLATVGPWKCFFRAQVHILLHLQNRRKGNDPRATWLDDRASLYQTGRF